MALHMVSLNPVSGLTTPETPEYSLSANQGRGHTMQCPLTNQEPYTFTNRIGANEQENPAHQISVDLSLDQSYEGLQRHR